VADVADGLTSVLDDLREMARVIRPAIVSEGGIVPALKTFARRSTVPVELDVQAVARPPEPVGLKDRVEGLGGTIAIHSPAGAGTRLEAELPLSP
jgi:signal transduction histidine kinase